MTRPACRDCPFRVGSPLHYDADAMERLAAGDVPGCHARVGHQHVFATLSPPAQDVCVGYEEWLDDLPGRAYPTACGTRGAMGVGNK